MEHTHGVSTLIDSTAKLDFDEDQGEKELDQGDITDYQVVVESLMDAAHATRPDISYVVSARSHYTSWPISSHKNAARRVLRYLKSTADIRLHLSSSCIGNDTRIDIGNCVVG